MQEYKDTPVSEQFKKGKPVIIVLLVIIVGIGIFLGITYFRGRESSSPPKIVTVDISHYRSEMKRLVSLLNSDEYKRAGIMKAWAEGEDLDPDSGESHLYHIRACCAIVLDSEMHGTLIDDRLLAESKDQG
ncbi:hypothetical protein KA005_73655 [bacterium]|nr:hypothetical protein [bacterium]